MQNNSFNNRATAQLFKDQIDEEGFNTMVVLQPSVSSCGIGEDAQFVKSISGDLLLAVPKYGTKLIIVSLRQMLVVKEHDN